ncbi:MAG: DUF1501 domain-containing protein [Metallibacterium scheffleri]|jgi:uncharacterized protein (DUF1501 family)|uniref:DUF1501 domain-containing protein n=1 Tax=Metallibacterium scheffleri TaxID=993689 RepID=UPI0026F1B4B9|nr:DUF1501 domain-containing protein [Metallibacterium scheffleri]MCK9367717.1 DUF1501 domain-containing protein [Metallibacterium scheffleri]
MNTRREFLRLMGLSATAAATLTLWPGITLAATGADTRLLVLMLRGGLDGLHALPPYGDPGYAQLRGPLALTPNAPTAEDPAALRLDGTFALHPALAFAQQLYQRGQLLPIVAAAPPYWGRSHFEAQDCVENGTATPDGAQTGWLNRVVAALPSVDGLAVSTVMPLMMRGGGRITTWSPPLPMRVNPILLQRLEPLYAEDPRLAVAFADALASQGAGSGVAMAATGAMAAKAKAMGSDGRLPQLMQAAGTFMARADGPRIGFVEDYGWDTHANQAAILSRKLKELDNAFASFAQAAQPVWSRMVMVVVTEFGRTARINGTNGTDHGTGGVMFAAGGAVAGGRVGGQWPGMRPQQLYQDRDIHATTDFRAVFKGLLAAHLGLSETVLATRVFPGSARLAPQGGLLRADRAA